MAAKTYPTSSDETTLHVLLDADVIHTLEKDDANASRDWGDIFGAGKVVDGSDNALGHVVDIGDVARGGDAGRITWYEFGQGTEKFKQGPRPLAGATFACTVVAAWNEDNTKAIRDAAIGVDIQMAIYEKDSTGESIQLVQGELVGVTDIRANPGKADMAIEISLGEDAIWVDKP